MLFFFFSAVRKCWQVNKAFLLLALRYRQIKSYKLAFSQTRYTSIQRYGIKIMSRSGLVIVVQTWFLFSSRAITFASHSSQQIISSLTIISKRFLLYCWVVITASLGILVGLFLFMFFLSNTWPENTKCSQNRLIFIDVRLLQKNSYKVLGLLVFQAEASLGGCKLNGCRGRAISQGEELVGKWNTTWVYFVKGCGDIRSEEMI